MKILPPATLGMLGGGQLGRFFVLAAHEMGYRVAVLDPDPHSPAGRAADVHLCASYDDLAALDELSGQCAAVTTEFENVPADTLAYLSKFVPVRPSAECVAVAQNRIAEKAFLCERGFAVGPYAVVRCLADIDALPTDLFPAVLKVSRFGYDGKGQARVLDAAQAKLAWQRFACEPCVIEKLLDLKTELSCVVGRDAVGGVEAFPVVENSHRHGILDMSVAPAPVEGSLCAEAEQAALGIAAELGYVGVLAVEFFVTDDGLLVNEIAPRPHNSGHFTLDACSVSQFEQQVRALAGLPLCPVLQHSTAVMVNLLGDLWYTADPAHAHEPPWNVLLSVPQLRLHLYRKHHARPGRKMGHFTVIARESTARVLKIALGARTAIGIRDD
ncbi:MAG: 5-(carboxyamino)imidazole ribonucleotide synthase [Rhodocyclaceae bacterium]|nr:5-(carboxyamino)imidazole ribonucleotide synthase [Rhodocyclaceae bacterium]MBX3668187.1 5-(carboxyamino)imidazole ribonucleotide synthase [Rhodocyclaceae bacterium]